MAIEPHAQAFMRIGAGPEPTGVAQREDAQMTHLTLLPHPKARVWPKHICTCWPGAVSKRIVASVAQCRRSYNGCMARWTCR